VRGAQAQGARAKFGSVGLNTLSAAAALCDLLCEARKHKVRRHSHHSLHTHCTLPERRCLLSTRCCFCSALYSDCRHAVFMLLCERQSPTPCAEQLLTCIGCGADAGHDA